MNLPSRLFACIVFACACTLACAQAPHKAAPNEEFEKYLRAEYVKLREQAAKSTQISELGPAIDRLFDLGIAYCVPAGDAALVGDINLLRREIRHLALLKPDQTKLVQPVLFSNPDLARAVVLSIGPDDSVAGAYRVLGLLSEKFPERILDKPAAPPKGARPGKDAGNLSELVAAFCIVFDGSDRARAAGGGGGADQFDGERVAALFNYYSTNYAKMLYNHGTPPEVLAYVISTPCSVDELTWALKNYQNNRQVGKLYSTIVYDTGAFKYSRPKKITKEPGGYTLMNIKKVGGVCAEQAYFAANVGRAIGVPAVVDTAMGSDVGHAWVGYLKSTSGNKHEWDFDEGRYREYQSIRGNVLDPQSGKTVADGFVAVTAGYMNTPQVKREAAVGLFDAAERIATVEMAKTLFPPSVSSEAPKSVTTPRALGVATQLDLIEAGVRACPVNKRGWDMVARLATNGELNAEQMDRWSKAAIELCGNEYPDFCLAVLTPMYRTIKPEAVQDKSWEWLHGRFNMRKDLAAAVRFEQGQMWEKAGDTAKAWEMYSDCIQRYANDGQIIVEALRYAEKLLDKQGKQDQVLPLYAGAFGRITKPEKMSNEFAAGSTYVSVGRRYIALLEKAGKTADAKRIKDQLEQVIGKEKDTGKG